MISMNTQPETKTREKERLQQDVDDFLKRGGTIYQAEIGETGSDTERWTISKTRSGMRASMSRHFPSRVT